MKILWEIVATIAITATLQGIVDGVAVMCPHEQSNFASWAQTPNLPNGQVGYKYFLRL